MGLVTSCCPQAGPQLSSHFNREEVIAVPEPKKTSVFVNTDTLQDATPLLRPTDPKVVEITDSESDGFDPVVIDRLLHEEVPPATDGSG
jgi:hypothetical protein